MYYHVPYECFSKFWWDVVLISCYRIHRLLSSILKFQTPYPVLHYEKNVFPLFPRVFGFVCFIYVHHQQNKLSPLALKCVFLGYFRTQKG